MNPLILLGLAVAGIGVLTGGKEKSTVPIEQDVKPKANIEPKEAEPNEPKSDDIDDNG